MKIKAVFEAAEATQKRLEKDFQKNYLKKINI